MQTWSSTSTRCVRAEGVRESVRICQGRRAGREGQPLDFFELGSVSGGTHKRGSRRGLAMSTSNGSGSRFRHLLIEPNPSVEPNINLSESCGTWLWRMGWSVSLVVTKLHSWEYGFRVQVKSRIGFRFQPCMWSAGIQLSLRMSRFGSGVLAT